MKKHKVVGKCDYCKDPIYDFQKKVEIHKGCSQLKLDKFLTKETKRTSRNKTSEPA